MRIFKNCSMGLWLASMICSQAVGAQELPSAALQGDFRARAAVLSPVQGADWYSLLRFRPEFLMYWSNTFAATLTIRAERLLGRLENLSASQGSFEVDRAFFDVSAGRLDLRVGKQAINMGSALIWNPIDLIDQNTALDFQVNKRGIDAVRASFSLSSVSSLQAILAYPEEKTLSLLRLESLLGNTSVALVGAHDGRKNDWILGWDLKGDLGLGFWLEGTLHWPSAEASYHEIVLGCDYSFPLLQNFVVAAQFHRKSNGGTGVENYEWAALLRGENFLGRHYSSVVATLAFNEWSKASASWIQNLHDQSFVLTGGWSRYFFENLETTVRISYFGGVGPGEFHPDATTPLQGKLPGQTYELWLEWRF